jgi:hypothetical protein
VVGALAVRALCSAHGTPCLVGGLTWERSVVDPLPGPRRLDELTGAEPVAEGVALAGPDTRGPGGVRFAESRVAELLGEPTVLVDPHPGPAGVAAGIAAAARHLDCDLVVLFDVGGDVLAHGDEAGLGSPLADAVLLATAPHLARAGVPSLGAVFGAGCDGELTPAEVLARLAEVRAAGGDRGAHVPPDLTELRAGVAAVPTEASAMALRCAEGDRGTAPIRGGRRTVELTEAGGLVHLFDPGAAMASAARLAAAVVDCSSLEAAESLLAGRGIRSELAYERDRAAGR